jgi:hypothetical protein
MAGKQLLPQAWTSGSWIPSQRSWCPIPSGAPAFHLSLSSWAT